MAKRNSYEGVIQIGTRRDAVEAARAALMDILNCDRAGDAAKVAACQTLATLCEVKNVTITNCEFRTE